MKYYWECRTKIEGPLRLADYGFRPSRHTYDLINEEKVIKIMLEIAIFSVVARSLLAKITTCWMQQSIVVITADC